MDAMFQFLQCSGLTRRNKNTRSSNEQVNPGIEVGRSFHYRWKQSNLKQNPKEVKSENAKKPYKLESSKKGFKL